MAGGISRSQITVSVNNDKTGYSLTAGSYSIRASSVQRGTITLAAASSNTASISSVTTTRAVEGFNGFYTNADNVLGACHFTLTNSTTVTLTKSDTSGTQIATFVVSEFF